MPPTRFGVGQAVTRKEDDADPARGGPLCRRFRAGADAARRRPALAARARALPYHRCGDRARHAGRAADPHRPPTSRTSARFRARRRRRTSRSWSPPYPVLARDEVRHVGDAVAFVVADTVEQASDAAEAIAVEWEPLPHVIDAAAALEPRRAAGMAGTAGNVAFETTIGDEATTRKRVRGRRAHGVAQPRQPAAGHQLPRYARRHRRVRRRADRTTLTLSSQGSHAVRDMLCRACSRSRPSKLRVMTPDVGGGFGTKLFPYREYALAAVAAKLLQAPGASGSASAASIFSPTRRGATTSRRRSSRSTRTTASSRSTSTSSPTWARICPAMRRSFRSSAPACRPASTTSRPAISASRGVYTNTVPVDAYRGAGRPEAAYVIERLVDVAAREIGIAPDALRRKNFIRPAAMPYVTATGKTYDSGDVRGAHGAGAGDRRLGRLQPARPGFAAGGKAARHRACHLYRGVRQQRPGYRRGEARTRRRDHRARRIAVDRAGSPHRLCAADRRASWPAARAGAGASRATPM